MKESIFSRFDIRGKYPNEINENVAYRLGLALSKLISGKKAVIGSDIRENSQKLVNPLACALESAGFKVQFLEKVPTELIYYAVGSRSLDLGIQITASHNPWDETGFKIVTANVMPLASSGKLVELEEIFETINDEYNGQMPQNLEKIDLIKDYVDFTSSLIPDLNNLSGKILIVSFGESGAKLAENFFANTKIEAKIINYNQQKLGDNAPNPMLPENESLAKREINEDFDLAVMLDGDSDRVMLINSQNKEVILGDLTAALIAQSILEQNSGSIVFDLRKKMVMSQVTQKFKVPLIQTYAGYPYIKAKMLEEKAVFGGEITGHFFYPQSYYSENSMLSIVLILNYLKKKNLTLDQSLTEFKNIFSITEQLFDLNQIKNFDLNSLQQELVRIYPNAKIMQNDGIVVEGEDFYLDIRPSQTEPEIKLNIEAKNPLLLEKISKQISQLLV